jgi:diketogulonate reductase-like aldo/keto reductase
LHILVIYLNTGQEVLQLGIGTWKSSRQSLENVITTAVELGYRTIDTATRYGNLHEVGLALKRVDRSRLFITLKLWSDEHGNEREALDKVLEQLQIDALDCYLMHFPVEIRNGYPCEEYLECYKRMEGLLESGKTRSIGVCNFTATKLRRLIDECKVVPAIVQNEHNPYFQDRSVHEMCVENGIKYMSYSSLRSGKDNMLNDPVIMHVADVHECTVSQVILSWLRMKDMCIIPKTDSIERLYENAKFIQLSAEACISLDSLNRNKRSNESTRIFGIDIFQD